MSKIKPFSISKEIVFEAFERVKANKGVAGVDEESISEFEMKLENNLYKIWNRMSSGSYIPPPVRTVEIDKEGGKKRKLGIPTVSDRIAQMVVKIYLEPELESIFLSDSYGYRPNKSAIEAVGVTRERCWRYNWVIDLDIKGFFDNIDHQLMIQLLRKHTQSKWILMYVERWLKAPAQLLTGTVIKRDKGTPQGGVISPLIANLFLHHAFDEWMEKEFSSVPFERYADDAVVHCKSEKQARWIKWNIQKRLGQYKLELHPEKTKIVYCKDDDRKSKYPYEKFDFLGYTFRPRKSKNRWGKYFINFSPAVSRKATKKMHQTLRSWRLHLKSDKELEDLARMFNPIIRGWINYYGHYYKSALHPMLKHIDYTMARWAMRKHKKLKGHKRRAERWIRRIARKEQTLFAHWKVIYRPNGGQ